MIVLVVLSCIAAWTIYRYQQEVREGYRYAGRRVAPIKTWVLPVPQLYKDILRKYVRYYLELQPKDRIKFERKVCNFLYSKKFIPRNLDTIDIEARVLIAASAVQLTFGLPGIYLQHFDKILVYPNEYYSSITRQYHKGEVNPRFGIIVLSLNHFLEGYRNPGGQQNLGLHEMAHALRLENIIRNEEFRFFDDKLIQRMDEIAGSVCRNPHDYGNLLRPYACTNVHEFFSVSVESFFEQGEALKEQIPELYSILASLLRQDPLKQKGA